MKDKILPHEYDQSSIEELTKKVNEIIQSLEKEIDLNNSVENYQELLKLNYAIEKKFQKSFKSIAQETNSKIKNVMKKNEKRIK